MEITVKLYGDLRKFGNEFKLKDIVDSSEALTALYCQLNGFRMAIQKGLFNVKIGTRLEFSMETLKDDVHQPLENGDIIHITPVLAGSGGVAQTIIGAVLIVVGALTYWTGFGVYLVAAGVAMVASGVATMLTKPPETDMGKMDETEKKQSTSFSNLQNLVAQGRPVPLAIGRIMTGSLVIGKGLETQIINLIDEDKSQNRGAIWGLRRR